MAVPADPAQANPTPPRERQRLFFALWPGVAVRRQIADATSRLVEAQQTRGRRMRPDRYHLTLHFLGDFDAVPEALIDAAIVAADDVRGTGFELLLDRAGSFGGSRVGWVGPFAVPTGLRVLWESLGHALDRHHVPHPSNGTSEWVPHVTVLRGMRKPMSPGIEPIRWPVDGFVLIRSQSGTEGYAVLQHWELGG